MTALGTIGAPGPRIRADEDDRWWFVVDPLLIASALFIAGLGIVLVFSATRGPVTDLQPADATFLERQLFSTLVGAGFAFGAALIDVRRIRRITPFALAAFVALLVGVVLVGVDVNGVRAWYSVGGFAFQPSEPGKIVLIVALAAVLAAPGITVGRLAITLALSGLPVWLILLQPDMGTILGLHGRRRDDDPHERDSAAG